MSLSPPISPPATGARGISLVVLVVATLIAAGCAVAGTAIYFELRPAPSASGVTVVDDLGRSVTAPANPTRVVVLAPSVLDIVYRLGLRDRVVGIGCDVSLQGGLENEYTPNQSSLWGVQPALCIGDYPSISVDELLNVSPQLVLASTLTSAADVEQISVTYHLPVVLLAPTSMEGIVNDVRIVGELFPAASSVVNGLVSLLDQELVSAGHFDTNLSTDGTPLPSLLLTYYFDQGGYYTYGPDSFGQSLVDVLGAVSIASSSPLVYFELNATVVLNDNPDVILYGTSSDDPWIVANETPAQWQSATAGAPYWSQLNGTKDPIDITLVTEADPTLILALPLLLHLVHPTLAPPA